MSMTTDSLVADIRKMSNESDFKTLITKLESSQEHIAQLSNAVLDTVIECLDVRNHSLGVMAALAGKLSREVSGVDWSTVLPQMREFVSKFTPEQIKENPVTFCNLIHKFTEQLCLRRRTLEGIAIVRTAIERYTPKPTTLTAIHCDLIQLCLMAKNLKPALPFLDREYDDLLTEDHQFDVKYVLLFYYYGGMVYTCLHDYLKALLFYTVCLTVPTVAISAIMVAAYKKFIIVSVLKFGKEIALPRYASHIVERALKPLCNPYVTLGHTYSSGKQDALEPVVSKFNEIFTNDGNAGLVQRVVSQFKKYRVQRLTHTFMTVGLADVSSRIGLSSEQEAEKYIRDMMEDGEIHASLDQVGQMVSFIENPESYDSVVMVQHLDKQLQECMALEKKLTAFDKQLSLEPRYIHRVMTSGGGMEDDPLLHDEVM